MYNIINIRLVGTIVAIFFAIVNFFHGYLKDRPIIRFIYPENWHKYIKIYFFTNINVDNSDLDCSDVSIPAEKVDPKSEFTYQIPFKLCIPKSDEKIKKIDKLIITFGVGQENDLHIIKYTNQDMGKTIELNQQSLQSGFQGRYYIKITRSYGGVSVAISVDAQINQRNQKRSWVMRTNIIINGLETKSIKLRT